MFYETYETNAERIYKTRNRNKTIENMERQQERLVKMHNSVFSAISNMKNAKDYVATRNLLNAFSQAENSSTVEVYRLRKMLDKKVTELLEANDKQMESIQKEINNIKSIRVEENTEHLKQLELESNNILYSYMAQLHTDGINENSDRRRIGTWAKTPTRVEAIALQKLCSLPQYSKYFNEKQRKVIVTNAQNPDILKHEQAMKPILQEKESALAKCYMQGFQLRNVQKQVSNELKNSMREG